MRITPLGARPTLPIESQDGKKLIYRNLYEGIDLVFYAKGDVLEHDFIVHPGSDPAAIQLAFENAKPSLSSAGELILNTQDGYWRQSKPAIFQTRRDSDVPRAGGYVIKADQTVGFQVGEYDHSQPLVIDPITYAGYLGGARVDVVNDVALDGRGAFYAVGSTSSADFPTRGANISAGTAAFVIKATPSGVDWIALIKGNSAAARAVAITVDAGGNPWVAINAGGGDLVATKDAFQPAFGGGQDAVVARLNADSGAIEFLSYLGGPGDESAFDIAALGSGRVVLVGSSTLAFPTTSNAFQRVNRGQADLFLTVINGNRVEYSSLFGGAGEDLGLSVAADHRGGLALGGITSSRDFPAQGALRGPQDAVIIRLNRELEVSFSSYFGGSGSDGAYDLLFDRSGKLNVALESDSRDLPSTDGSRFQGGFRDIVLTRWNEMTYEELRFLGTPDFDSVAGLGLDPFGRVSIAWRTTLPQAIEFAKFSGWSGCPNGVESTIETLFTPAGKALHACISPGSAFGFDRGPRGAVWGGFVSQTMPVLNSALFPRAAGEDAFVAFGVIGPDELPELPSAVYPVCAADGSQRTARGSIVSIFGDGRAALSNETMAAAALPLPEALGGRSAMIVDSAGRRLAAGLLFVSPRQFNVVFDGALATGPALLEIGAASSRLAHTWFEVSAIAPCLFTANAQGFGIAAANAVQLTRDGRQTQQALVDAEGRPLAVDLTLGVTAIELYGTGLGPAGAAVTAALSWGAGRDFSAPALGPFSTSFAGLQQINLDLSGLPASPSAGVRLGVAISVEGMPANVVEIPVR